MSNTSYPATLSSFLSLLEENMRWEFDLDNFDDRLRLQKYVHLAEGFGFDNPYSYGMYLHGPYSPDLAQDYYSELPSSDPGHESLSGFQAEKFIQFIQGRETRWLEVAATIRAHTKQYEYRVEEEGLSQIVIEKTMEDKDEDRQYVEEVFAELRQASLV